MWADLYWVKFSKLITKCYLFICLCRFRHWTYITDEYSAKDLWREVTQCYLSPHNLKNANNGFDSHSGLVIRNATIKSCPQTLELGLLQRFDYE